MATQSIPWWQPNRPLWWQPNQPPGGSPNGGRISPLVAAQVAAESPPWWQLKQPPGGSPNGGRISPPVAAQPTPRWQPNQPPVAAQPTPSVEAAQPTPSVAAAQPTPRWQPKWRQNQPPGGSTINPPVIAQPTLPVAAHPALTVAAHPDLPVEAQPALPVAAQPTLPMAAQPTLPMAAQPTPSVAAESTPRWQPRWRQSQPPLWQHNEPPSGSGSFRPQGGQVERVSRAALNAILSPDAWNEPPFDPIPLPDAWNEPSFNPIPLPDAWYEPPLDPYPLPDIWYGPALTDGASSSTVGISDHERNLRYFQRGMCVRKAGTQVYRHIQTVTPTYRLKHRESGGKYFPTARTVNHCLRIEAPQTSPYCELPNSAAMSVLQGMSEAARYRAWPDLRNPGIGSAAQYWCREYNRHGGTHLDFHEYVRISLVLEQRFRASSFITSALNHYARRWGDLETTSLDCFRYTPVRLGRFYQALSVAYRFQPIVRLYDHAVDNTSYPLLDEVRVPLGEKLKPISYHFFDGDGVASPF